MIVAPAVESPEKDVRTVATAGAPDLRWAIADAATAQAFGDITAVPALFLFDRQGKATGVWYGAPPDLHEQVEKKLGALLGD
mgnify:FL=1